MCYINSNWFTWAKAKFSTVSEAKCCNRYSLERARACRSTGSAMVGEEDRQYSSATDSRTLPTKRTGLPDVHGAANPEEGPLAAPSA